MAPKRPKRTKEEVLRIWQKIDKNNSGSVTGEEVLQQARVLETECPEFIQNWEQVARDGKVTRQAFLNFFAGRSSTKTDAAAAEVDREVNLEKLKAIFDEITSGGSELRLADLIEHRARIKAVFPALLENFSQADMDGSSTLSWDEVRVFAAGTDEWLEYHFDRIIGLEGLKDQIRQFHRSVILDKKRREAGFDVKAGGKFHMIFQGNPGTGKTTVGRLVSQLLQRIGIIKADLLVEVQRDKLVAEYVGQTGPKTQQVIEEAKQGVLFIDEAYRLSQAGGKNDFGKEAIEQLMAAMNDPPGKAPVMIFAGYPDDMVAFMKANEGLYRRIAYTFDFSDYTPVDLAQILDQIAKSSGFRLAPGLTNCNFRRLGDLIEKHTLEASRSLMNGGICERIFTFAKQALDARDAEAAASGSAPSVELSEEDILTACARIPPPPPRDDPGTSAIGRLSTGAGSADGAADAGRAERLEALNRSLEAQLAHAMASLESLRKTGGGDAAALAAEASRAARAEAELARARAQVEVLQTSEAELARVSAELTSLRRSSSATGDAATTLAEAEGRAARAESELKRLQAELEELKTAATGASASSPGAGVVAPPAEYDARQCLKYSCGCCWFFTLLFVAFVQKWTVIFAKFCWKWANIFVAWCREKIQQQREGGKSTATVTPAIVTVTPVVPVGHAGRPKE